MKENQIPAIPPTPCVQPCFLIGTYNEDGQPDFAPITWLSKTCEGEDDLLIITADHGNDPTYTGTDHTREKVPFLAYSKSMTGSGELPETDTFAVIGATVADIFGVEMPEGTIGESILEKLQ